MQTPLPGLRRFGRRTQPHRFILARGETVRSVTLPAWLTWAGAGAGAAAAAWLIASTIYITFNEDITEAVTTHRVGVERAYEDRIAQLRQQIDQINTRQFLDQQAFEYRLNTLITRQETLEQRHIEIAGLFDDARARKLSIHLDGTGQTGGTGSYAGGPAFDPSRPAPLDAASRRPAATGSGSGNVAIDNVQSSLGRLESMQTSMLDALETAVADVSDQLVQVSGAIGAPLPEAAAAASKDLAEATGGPLVELRRGEEDGIQDRQVDRLRSGMERLSLLEAHVDRLPVRVPLEGHLDPTSGFGRRIDPFLGRPALHTGLDLRAETGTPVHATAAGRVSFAGYSGGYGRMVEIDHGNGYRTRYAHMSLIAVETGANVGPGDVIGRVGTTGRSTGPHLHYEMRVQGSLRDPMPFIQAAELLPAGF